MRKKVLDTIMLSQTGRSLVMVPVRVIAFSPLKLSFNGLRHPFVESVGFSNRLGRICTRDFSEVQNMVRLLKAFR